MKGVNIHTHHIDAQSDDYQVLSLEALDFLSMKPSEFDAYLASFPSNIYFSVGIHPWKAHDIDFSAAAEFSVLTKLSAAEVLPSKPSLSLPENLQESLRCMLQHPRVVLMGEMGLDKVCDAPYDKQLKLFEQQLMLAAELNKPVILHVVKAIDDVLALHKRFSSSIPAWIVHGFRGNAQQAQQYLRHGFYLSFGQHYHPDALQICPPDRLFFETDDVEPIKKG